MKWTKWYEMEFSPPSVAYHASAPSPGPAEAMVAEEPSASGVRPRHDQRREPRAQDADEEAAPTAA